MSKNQTKDQTFPPYFVPGLRPNPPAPVSAAPDLTAAEAAAVSDSETITRLEIRVKALESSLRSAYEERAAARKERDDALAQLGQRDAAIAELEARLAVRHAGVLQFPRHNRR